MKYKLIKKKLLSDLYTPVGCYLKLRQKFHQVLLLESSDYSSQENSRSFLCFDASEGIQITGTTLESYNCNGETKKEIEKTQVVNLLKEFINDISIDTESDLQGIFGYSSYESVEYFETITFNSNKPSDDIPCLRYDFYRYCIVFDHFFDTLEIREYIRDNQTSQIDNIIQMLNYQDVQVFDFKITGEETSNIPGEDYKKNIATAKKHIQRGDIFQVVLSRRFAQQYSGDAFNVYRSLRTVNPSPYLYYFDYGNYSIFGSSPEAEIIVQNNKVEIHPIAGTFKRTGSTEEDLIKAEALKADPKENAEHVMLVDLARNDLSKHAINVHVKKYKEVQYFSHVIHLGSVVEGTLKDKNDAIDIYADTFPAGTLSGAPKYSAMQIIDRLESTQRGFYGGAIGMIGLSGEINHAIIIRSFLAKNKTLQYQAGAGIVIDSDEESELQEVNNKLAALKAAIVKAEAISNSNK